MVDILLATHNGEAFLETQIASIIAQTYSDWKLYIHDDGSTDRTVQIIRKWESYDSRIVFIQDNYVFHNPGKNFLHLLKFSLSKYICFCDQDDYWFEDKVEKMLLHFDDSIEPSLVLSDCYVWYSQNNSINKDYVNIIATSLESFLFLNGGRQGCAMMFNSELRELVLKYSNDYIYMHDHLVALVAFTFGKVRYIADKLYLYRQHDSNVSSHWHLKKADRYKQVLSNISLPVIYSLVFDAVKLFYLSFENEMKSESKKIFQLYLLLPDIHPFKRFFLILFSRFSLGDKGHLKLLIKLLLRKFI